MCRAVNTESDSDKKESAVSRSGFIENSQLKEDHKASFTAYTPPYRTVTMDLTYYKYGNMSRPAINTALHGQHVKNISACLGQPQNGSLQYAHVDHSAAANYDCAVLVILRIMHRCANLWSTPSATHPGGERTWCPILTAERWTRKIVWIATLLRLAIGCFQMHAVLISLIHLEKLVQLAQRFEIFAESAGLPEVHYIPLHLLPTEHRSYTPAHFTAWQMQVDTAVPRHKIGQVKLLQLQ